METRIQSWGNIVGPVASRETADSRVVVPHVIRGRTVMRDEVEHRSRDLGGNFVTATLDLDELIWPRTESLPAADVPMTQILDFLVELGRRLDLDYNRYLQQALESSVICSSLGPRILENCYRDMAGMFDRQVMEDELYVAFGGTEMLDGWHERTLRRRKSRVRAFPARLVHVLAGNSPMVVALTVMRCALTKGAHLMKLPSNDLFTGSAILRTMADIDAGHPVTRSFSAAYWRGGDDQIESILYRAQYFDKIVVWGGEGAVRHVKGYVGPGFEMIAFDPKVSVSFIGREAFLSDEALQTAARGGAADVLSFNQDACNASRYQFVEGDLDDVDRYAAALAEALKNDVRYGSGHGPRVPENIRHEVEVLRELEPIYRIYGDYEGSGLVVRSDEMVSFHPNGKTVNVVAVESLSAATRYATVATQTVGIYPSCRASEVRDALANAGVQRIVSLGDANSDGVGGYPHDAMIPVHRFVKWISEEAAS